MRGKDYAARDAGESIGTFRSGTGGPSDSTTVATSAPAAAWIGISAVNDNNTSSVVPASVSRVLARSTGAVLRWRSGLAGAR